jgi:hypothetical protein
MENRPVIRTAVPQRRYQLSDFSIVVLGEIDSGDGLDYRYLLAVVREGDSQPGLYLTAEPSGMQRSEEGWYTMRLIMHGGCEVVGTSTRWGDLDVFAQEALDAVRKVLGLSAEEAVRLL